MLDTSSRERSQNHGVTWNNKTNKIMKKKAFNRKITFNRQDQCYYQKEANIHNNKAKKKKNLTCWMLLRHYVALPPSWRKLEKEEMGFLLQVWTKQKQNHKMKNLVAGNSTKNKSKNWKWGYKTQTTKMKKKETKQKKQVGENGRNESRLQDGRRLQKKTRVTLKMTKH